MNKKTIYLILGVLTVCILSIFVKENYAFLKSSYMNIMSWLELIYPQSSFRNILEIIYFVTSPLLLAVAVIGLKQIDIAKDTSRLNDRRASFTLAAEQHTYFIEKIIPQINKIIDEMQKNNIKNFGEAKLEINDKKEICIEYKINKVPGIKELQVAAIDVLNLIDGFSTYFNAGVAEETVAFSSLGGTFIEGVDKLLPILCWGQDNGGGYENVIELYLRWKNKIEKQKDILEKNGSEKNKKQTFKINQLE